MSKMLSYAQKIGANFALIVCEKHSDNVEFTRFYKRGSWQLSRNCMLVWNDDRQRWDNSSELSFVNIQRGLRWTFRKYTLIDFDKQERVKG